MTIGYIHIRPGQTYSKENGLTGTPLAKGGTTIAYSIPEPGVVDYAVAHCSPRDSYNRKLGRAVAEGRLNKGNGPHAGAVTLYDNQTAPEAIITWLNKCGVL